jgi:hypothetical protein
MGVAGTAVVATASVAGAAIDTAGNLYNTNNACTAKIQKGWFPPQVLNSGTLIETFGRGNCDSPTIMNHGMIEIQTLDKQGNWNTVASTTFGPAPNGTFFGVTAPGPGTNGQCTTFRARTQVWRNADNGGAATVNVASAGVVVGTIGQKYGVCKN